MTLDDLTADERRLLALMRARVSDRETRRAMGMTLTILHPIARALRVKLGCEFNETIREAATRLGLPVERIH